MRSYECMIIFSPDAEQGGGRQGVKKYARLIVSRGGEITKLEEWGRRRLAYKIEHHEEGDYIVLRFRSDNEVLSELDRQLRLDEKVLRHLIVRDVIAKGDEPKIDIEGIQESGATGKEEV